MGARLGELYVQWKRIDALDVWRGRMLVSDEEDAHHEDAVLGHGAGEW